MITYSCRVKLGGKLHNEVRKNGVTAAEAVILKLLHGDESVDQFAAMNDDPKRDNRSEMERLQLIYGGALAAGGGGEFKSVKAIFGLGGQLPQEIEGVEPPKAGKPQKPGRATSKTKAQKRSEAAAPAPKDEPETEAEAEDENDGQTDMADLLGEAS